MRNLKAITLGLLNLQRVEYCITEEEHITFKPKEDEVPAELLQKRKDYWEEQNRALEEERKRKLDNLRSQQRISSNIPLPLENPPISKYPEIFYECLVQRRDEAMEDQEFIIPLLNQQKKIRRVKERQIFLEYQQNKKEKEEEERIAQDEQKQKMKELELETGRNKGVISQPAQLNLANLQALRETYNMAREESVGDIEEDQLIPSVLIVPEKAKNSLIDILEQPQMEPEDPLPSELVDSSANNKEHLRSSIRLDMESIPLPELNLDDDDDSSFMDEDVKPMYQVEQVDARRNEPIQQDTHSLLQELLKLEKTYNPNK